MKEAFLQYVWQHQLFNKVDLKTQDGNMLHIIYQGMLNHDSGPDFSMARIKIDNIEWLGNIEIHYKSSDWFKHAHTSDNAYANTILHVVWHHDKEVLDKHQKPLPTIVLKGLIDQKLINTYEQLLKNTFTIPCQSYFSKIPTLHWYSMLDKTMSQRLEFKAAQIANILHNNGQDWEETTYQILLKNFGFKTNADTFETLAQKTPHKIIKHLAPDQFKIEAILLGQSGLLVGQNENPYIHELEKEYRFLKAKYKHLGSALQAHEWKFSKLRPSNFPTIRIAQLASILAKWPSLFSEIIHSETTEAVKELFQSKVTEFWNTHYTLKKESPKSNHNIGSQSLENIILNTVVPLLACYAISKDQEQYMERALSFLQELSAEKNKITQYWSTLKMPIKSAFDSQASIHLFNHFCTQKKCLECTIGNEILKQKV
jgi:hypothetical protein